jgi:hypothetical protein
MFARLITVCGADGAERSINESDCIGSDSIAKTLKCQIQMKNQLTADR